ncbi:MAG: GAF domain-containing protein [Bacillaceae bacterium]|nr:GAF domain-containing protein [Bacillaceae bacterium]
MRYSVEKSEHVFETGQLHEKTNEIDNVSSNFEQKTGKSYTTFEKVAYRDKLLQAIANATHTLITNRDQNKAVLRALQFLGEAVYVDRVYIFEHHNHPDTGRPATSQRYEWTQGDVEPQIANPDLQNVEYTDMQLLWWYERLIHRKTVNGLIRQMPEPGRKVLEEQGIISLLVLPIYIGDELWGFIGFDDCHNEREWSADDELILTAVAASFGGMVKRMDTEKKLQQTLNELSTFNEKLEEKIKQAVIENQQKEMMIQQQSKQVAMGDIINSIAHQWRQPLNGISLMASNIALDAELGSSPEEIIEQANQIIEVVGSMSQTITDFMGFFNDNQKLTTFSIQEVMKCIFDLMQSQIYSRNIVLYVEALEDIQVTTHRNDLQQVLINIMSNAIHAFDDRVDNRHRKIQVSATLKEEMVLQVYIQDNAGGIPQDYLDEIFKPYFTTKQKGKGTGLGLSISKKIVEERLQGKIHALNYGAGAQFVIEIPLLIEGDHDND